MKGKLLAIALAAITVGLLGSCSKINERIDNLEKTIDGIENDRIASVEQQIIAIKESIADLETIRTNIQTLIDAKTAQSEDITKLKAADQTLEGKIAELKTYVETGLVNSMTEDWANATFATLEQQAELMTGIDKLKTDLAGIDENLDKAISDLEGGMKDWVNEQLSAYCTAAQMDAKAEALENEIDVMKADAETNKSDIEKLEADLAKLTGDLEAAKSAIKSEYEKAIKDAIEGNEGYITATIKDAIDNANGKITDLTGRMEALETTAAALQGDVDALKAMIQSVSIIPAYSNGSVEAKDGILTIDCVITPKTVLDSLKKESFTVFTSEVLTKSAAVGTIKIAKDEDLVLDKENGMATIKVDVSSVLPTEEDKALTVAVNVKNGISDYTTEFVAVYAAAASEPSPVTTMLNISDLTITTVEDTYTVESVTFVSSNAGGKKWAIDNKSQSWTNPADDKDTFSFTKRIKSGGKSDFTKRGPYFEIPVAKGSTIELWFISGSTGSVRSVSMLDGTFSDTATVLETASNDGTALGYHSFTYNGSAGKAVFTFDNGVNFFGIRVTTTK